jgi:hypothetical protein
MEKAKGVQLYQKWGEMKAQAKLSLAEQLVQLESQLASIHFPASGSLYLRDTVQDEIKCKPLDADIDPTQSYCIGPSADRAWCIQSDVHIADMELNRGPC